MEEEAVAEEEETQSGESVLVLGEGVAVFAVFGRQMPMGLAESGRAEAEGGDGSERMVGRSRQLEGAGCGEGRTTAAAAAGLTIFSG